MTIDLSPDNVLYYMIRIWLILAAILAAIHLRDYLRK